MTNKVKVLIASIVIAVIVCGCGLIFGSHTSKESTSETKGKVEELNSSEKDTLKQEGSTESDSQVVQGDTTALEDTTAGEETTGLDENSSSDQAESASEDSTVPGEETTVETTTAAGTMNVVPMNSNIDPNKPMVALTFDDGPSAANTNRLLDCLEQYGARATFFCVGTNIQGNEDIIRREAAIGCEVANHTMNHPQLTTLGDDGVIGEVGTVSDMIKNITGQEYVILRPPYGDVNEHVLSLIGTSAILWSIDTLDWKTRDADSTVASIQNNVGDGDVILMHDIHTPTVDAAVRIIPWLIENGYQLVTVSELAYYKRGGLQPGQKYSSFY